VSLQVLQEYFVTVTRKLHVDPRIARRKVELIAEFDIAFPEVADILAAIDLHRLHGVSFWDALSSERRSKRAAAFSSQKICKEIGKSMEFRSSTRFSKSSRGTAEFAVAKITDELLTTYKS
jgi:hypothetical protein